MDRSIGEIAVDPPWRYPAPVARRLAMTLYAWRDPFWIGPLAFAAALPVVLAAALAPALLSLAPAIAVIAPIADARAVADGAAHLKDLDAPSYALFVLAADLFADAPGRIHLVAKAIAAACLAAPFAFLAAARFPAIQSVFMTAMLAAYVAAPFAGPPEIGLAAFLTACVALVAPSAEESQLRASLEGAIAGLLVALLWLTSAPFSLAALLVLGASPFVNRRSGLRRYAIAVAVFAALVLMTELASPGLVAARTAAASTLLASERGPVLASGALGLASGALMVIAMTAIFGGLQHWRGWGPAFGVLAIALLAARMEGANPAPLFVVAAALAALSPASPFYAGVFREHDRASVAAALTAAGLVFLWTVAVIADAGARLLTQGSEAAAAPADIRTELALVQPGGAFIARWIEDGRLASTAVRKLLDLPPTDQAAMLLEAAGRARRFERYGVAAAILTGPDAACVLTEKPKCDRDGASAAGGAGVVLVPRLDLDSATAAAKRKSEALLYVNFRLVEQGAFWDIWVRRGAHIPLEAGLLKPSV